MNSDISITSEQLVKEALQSYKTEHSDPDVLVANTIARIYPNADAMTVRAMALSNSVAAGIQKLEDGAKANEREFYDCGQMSLLGELIPEHSVPKEMMSQSVLEMDEWMSARAKIERDNADELRRAAEAQERKAKRYEGWSLAVHKVRTLLEEAGINPSEVSYAEAISKAETIHSGNESFLGEKAGRTVR